MTDEEIRELREQANAFLPSKGWHLLDALIAERDAMAKVVEAAESLAEVEGVSFAGPGQYVAAGRSLQLRDAIEALDVLQAVRKATR